MSILQHLPILDFRNEGWSLFGSGVTNLFNAWSAIGDDTKYASCPSYKGRACVSFPIDTTNVPDGAVITSITVYLRCKKAFSGNHSITCNVSCLDDTARFTSRTIYPTTTITTYEIGTYQCDPLGFHWDRHRLNQLLCQLFSYSGVLGAILCYEFYCVVNYRVRPTITVDAPTGTVNTPTPALSWTYTQTDGDPQSKAEYKLFTSIQQESSTFNPDTSAPVYAGSIVGDITSLTLPTPLTPDSYYVYVRSYSTYLAKSLWIGRAFTVQGAAPGVPGGGDGGGGASVGSGGGAGFVSCVADNISSSAFLTLRDGSNLLSVQEADFETSSDGLGYTGTNTTPARDTTAFFVAGGGSMKLTAAAAATMSATSDFTEVADNTPITMRAQFKAAATGRTCNIRILFFDQNYNSVSGTISGTGTDSTSTWTEVACTGTTPVGSAFAQAVVEVSTPANAESHNIDGVGLMYGTNSVWSHGGHMSRNILSAQASNADGTITVEPWGSASPSSVSYTRVATAGTGSDGSNRFKLTYNGISGTIAFGAAGTVYSDVTTSTGYTLNKPASTVDGHLLIAFVTSTEYATLTPPTGWRLVNSARIDNGSGDVALWVLVKDGLTADPATWVGNVSVAAGRRRAVVLRYTGAASAASQFVAENVKNYVNGATAVTTASVTNTDPGAWRISAFAVRDDVTGGSMTANTVPPAITPAIAFVGAATKWASATSAVSSYTINKPSGVVSGDLMIATVAISNNTIATVTAPSGWTVVRQFTSTNGTAALRTAILKRTAGSSEPASWTGALSASVFPVITQAVAYRNAQDISTQFISEDQSVSASGSTVTTASVTNTNSSAWRVAVFASSSQAASSATSSETSERADGSAAYTTSSWFSTTNVRSANLSMYDSNAQIATGATTRTGTFSNSYYAGASWIGIINPLPAPPTPPANETARVALGTAGAADPFLSLAVFDNGGVAPAGAQSITGAFTPGSGTSIVSSAAWIGLLKPATPVVSGEAGATLSALVDISTVEDEVLTLADNKVTFQASFLGSSGGTPYLTLYFYNANELIQTQVSQGVSFGTSQWVKSTMTVAIPDSVTRIGCKVHVSDRLINDIVYFDRASISLGSATVYRSGTGRITHPIWNVPLVEYNDDIGNGYGDWQILPGASSSGLVYDQLTGITTFSDQTLVPLASRKYRARTLSYGLQGDRFISAYGPESNEVTIQAQEWWLKDLQNPTASMKLKVKGDPLEVGTSNTASVFQPLGEDFPVVLTEGYKGDKVAFTVIVTRTEYAQLLDLFDSGRTLFLQTNMDNAWWVRPVGDLGSATQLAGYGPNGTIINPLRFVDVTFVQVAPEL